MSALLSLASTGISGTTILRLDPAELGRVDIRIDRSRDGPASISLTAEKPETLALLVRDQAQLHKALDQAGVPAAGRSVSFSLAAIGTMVDKPVQPDQPAATHQTAAAATPADAPSADAPSGSGATAPGATGNPGSGDASFVGNPGGGQSRGEPDPQANSLRGAPGGAPGGDLGGGQAGSQGGSSQGGGQQSLAGDARRSASGLSSGFTDGTAPAGARTPRAPASIDITA